ncbi:MAG: tRNA preQ1(34) S-adenosylmethionine ribosyltransferase-isomerase QueA [Planctomycetota bacterium]
MRTDELDFELPDELIARRPADRRDAARLLHYKRASDAIAHRVVSDLPTLVRPGDVMVFNDARVTPAKFTLIKPTGGRVGGLFLEDRGDGTWEVLLKSPGETNTESAWRFGSCDPADRSPTATRRVAATRDQDESEIAVRVIERLGGGRYVLHVDDDRSADAVLQEVGQMPLPPYIGRAEDEPADRERYQTVYADKPGSVAAPTAGLHFTPELLAKLDDAGVIRTTLTLHVGMGTFKPVSADDLDDHDMHRERYELPAECCDIVNAAKSEGRRVIAVGTTSARVLEAAEPGDLQPGLGSTALFIRPPYQWRRVDALWTNFHLPRSTLIALVDAFVGSDQRRRLYQTAIDERYRFFSYGDVMFLE